MLLLLLACSDPPPLAVTRALPDAARLTEQCEDAVGPARVEEPVPGVFVAIGYDLANPILVATDAGNVLIDTGMSPTRAAPIREALSAAAPGPIVAVIYTHSHIDHVGGASAWVDPDAGDVDIWATAAFTEHFFKQYGVFRPIEAIRGARQFGWHVPESALPCAAIGRRIDLDAAVRTGFLVPTRTFEGRADFTVGGVRFELHEAHGETHDELFVWLPDKGALLPGDNWYRAFPNLYTVRGTRPRPVDDWIDSLDAMRRLEPTALIPSHTAPVLGRAEVAEALTTYRDGIQWVRDQVVRGANEGADLESIVAGAGLPPSLAGSPYLDELYGQIDWSARAIYGNQLGWFDGRDEALYPLPRPELAARSVAMMGGAEAVLAEAEAATGDDPRWALHLLALLVDAPESDALAGATARLDAARADALTALAGGVHNTNGRAWLMERVYELEHGQETLPEPVPGEALLAALPLSLIFEVLQTRLLPAEAAGVHETLAFVFEDTGERAFLTIRSGVLELAWGTPLPGTPEPVCVVTTTAEVWRAVAMKQRAPATAIASGDLQASDLAAFGGFMGRFQQ